MGTPVKFQGCNMVFSAPEGAENVKDLDCFTNGANNVLAVELDEAERKEFLETGRIFVSVLSGPNFFPIFVGTETSVRLLIAQDGGLAWPPPDDLAQQKLLREIHKLLGTEVARRQALRADPQKFNTAAVEIKRIMFNTLKLSEIKPVLTQYLEAINP